MAYAVSGVPSTLANIIIITFFIINREFSRRPSRALLPLCRLLIYCQQQCSHLSPVFCEHRTQRGAASLLTIFKLSYRFLKKKINKFKLNGSWQWHVNTIQYCAIIKFQYMNKKGSDGLIYLLSLLFSFLFIIE